MKVKSNTYDESMRHMIQQGFAFRRQERIKGQE